MYNLTFERYFYEGFWRDRLVERVQCELAQSSDLGNMESSQSHNFCKYRPSDGQSFIATTQMILLPNSDFWFVFQIFSLGCWLSWRKALTFLGCFRRSRRNEKSIFNSLIRGSRKVSWDMCWVHKLFPFNIVIIQSQVQFGHPSQFSENNISQNHEKSCRATNPRWFVNVNSFTLPEMASKCKYSNLLAYLHAPQVRLSLAIT